MKILVTGAAGFIGSNLCEFLLELGHNVIGIDNFNSYYNPEIKRYNLREFKDNSNFKLYEIDILDIENLAHIFKAEKPESVVHLAAWAGVTRSFKEPVTYVRNNIEGTVNVAELCVKHEVSSLIFASTSSIYGDNTVPFTEDMSTDHPLAPYPATKKACEVLLSTYSKNFGLNVSILRIFNPLGKRLRPDLALSILIKSCFYEEVYFEQYQDADSTGRDYAYLKHMFESMLTIMVKPFRYEIFNMGNSSPVTLGGLVEAVTNVVGTMPKIKKMPPRLGEMQITYANIDKARLLLGYSPKTTIEGSIKVYYEWFLKQDDWYKKVR